MFFSFFVAGAACQAVMGAFQGEIGLMVIEDV